MGISIADTFDAFLRDKGKGPAGEGGNYRRAVESELARFEAWCAGDQRRLSETREVANDWSGIYPPGSERDRAPTIEDIETQFDEYGHNIFRTYARHLRRQGYAASTAETYYNFVSSWCGWCVQEGRIPLSRHLAQMAEAKEPLSDDDKGTQTHKKQQHWSPEQRDRIVEILDERARAALQDLEETPPELNQEREKAKYVALRALRNRALVTLVAYTAVRGAEILKDPEDPRRDGVKWGDLLLEDNSFELLRKNQVRDEAPIPQPAVHSIKQWRNLLDPPSDEWPMFPSLHFPTVSQTVQTGLDSQGYDKDEIEIIRDGYERDFFVALDYDIPIQSITTDGLRRLLKRLCDKHDIPQLADDEYLQPTERVGAWEKF